MFAGGDLSDGRPYADTMARVTGFYHQPESHLFDLVPELYCADYLLGWMGEAVLAGHLRRRLGRQLVPARRNRRRCSNGCGARETAWTSSLFSKTTAWGNSPPQR